MTGRLTIDIVFTPLPAVVANSYFVAADKLQDLQGPMEEATQILAQEIRTNFQVGGRPKWQELDPDTVARKGGTSILVDTGRLRDLAPTSWAIEQSGRDWIAAWQDPTDYGTIHLTGSKFIPIRDFLAFTDEALDRIDNVMEQFLEQAFA